LTGCGCMNFEVPCLVLEMQIWWVEFAHYVGGGSVVFCVFVGCLGVG
jgi:hypothetical protein